MLNGDRHIHGIEWGLRLIGTVCLGAILKIHIYCSAIDNMV